MLRTIFTILCPVLWILYIVIDKAMLLQDCIAYTLAIALLWLPLRYTYKIKALKEFDAKYINTKLFRAAIRIIVGKKELETMDKLLAK
jgi:hypothetical protein